MKIALLDISSVLLVTNLIFTFKQLFFTKRQIFCVFTIISSENDVSEVRIISLQVHISFQQGIGHVFSEY